MNSAGAVGGIFNWTMNSGFDAVIILIAIAASAILIALIVKSTRGDLADLSAATSFVDNTAREGVASREAFAEQFTTVSGQLEKHRLVGQSWRRFATTVMPLQFEDGVTSETTLVSRSASPVQYFPVETLVGESMLARFAPAAFLTVFLLIAGIGLGVSVGGIATAFGSDLAGGNVSADLMSAAIASAGGKLLLIALVAALYAAIRMTASWGRTKLAEGVRRFNDALLDKIYFENADSASVRKQDAFHFQAKSLQRLGEKLTTSIGGTTRDAIVEGYMEVVTRMEALTKRYDDLVSAAQKGAREAVSKAFDESVEKSSDAVVKRMESVADLLAQLPARMEEASRALENAGANISSEQQRFALELQTTANETVASAASSVARNVEETVRDALAQSREVSLAVSERLGQLPERIEQAAHTFENATGQMINVQNTIAEDTQARTLEAVDAVSVMMKRAVGEIAQAVDETIAGSLLQTTQTLQSVGENMISVPDRLASVTQALEGASRQLSDTHKQVLSNLEAGTREMAATVGDTISARVDATTASFIQKLYESNDAFEERTQSLANLFTSLERTSETIADTHARALAEFQTSAREVTATTADTIAARVNENAASFIDKLHESNAAFEDRAQSLTGLFASLERMSETIADTHARALTDFRISANEITATTADIIAARVNENASSFVDKLHESNEAFETRAQSLSGILAAIERTSDGIAETHTRALGDFRAAAGEITAITADTIAARVEENSANFVEKLQEADDSFRTRAEGLTQLYTMLEQANARISETHTRFMSQMQQATRDMTASTAQSISRAINENTDTFMEKLNASNAMFEERAEALGGLFATLQKANERIADTHTRFMTQMQEGARELTEATATILADKVNETTVDFVGKLNESNSIFEERARALAGLFTNLETANDSLANTHARFMNEMQNSARDIISRTTGSIAEELQNNTADIVSRLRASDDFFASRVEALSSLMPQINQTGTAMAEIMERISMENGRVGGELAELVGTLHNATGNIKNSADHFAGNLTEVQSSLEHFQRLSKDTIEMVGTSQRTLKESIGVQAELWQRHVERFDDVDRKLGDVFGEISRQIDMQTRHMQSQVAEMDGALAAAVNHLGELVEELNETRAQAARSAGGYR